MKNIVVLPGDGIGKEITAAAVKILLRVAEVHQIELNIQYALIGASAIDKTGNPLPEDTIKACKLSHAVLLGAVGDPKFDNNPTAKVRPEQGLLKIRQVLGLYANIRPIKSIPLLYDASPLKTNLIENVDFMVFRELTGGIYFGQKGKMDDVKKSYDLCIYSEEEIERIAHRAFQCAQKRKKHLTLVDKANVLETSRLWREVVKRLSTDYSDVKMDAMYVDNAAMKLIQEPAFFDVILTENMFGDILTDEASVIVGSIGMLPSASVGDKYALFEPIHGSYPEGAGKNIANPNATILSVALLLEHIGFPEAAKAVNKAVLQSLTDGVVTPDLNPDVCYGTEEVANYIVKLL